MSRSQRGWLIALLGGWTAFTMTASPATAEEPSWLGERVRTARAIEIEATIAGRPLEVYKLWLSAQGLRTFFAPAARIDPVEGGRYEILFNPSEDPEGEREGTKGARILKLEEGRFLAFEWRGKASMTEMNVEPLPTWVELRFEPVPGDPDRTRFSLGHYGFGTGGGWELGYVFFKTAWSTVVGSLRARFDRASPKPSQPAAETIAALAAPVPTSPRTGPQPARR
jgi:uncharacterized protein YndB with AHSA1/START domain